MNIEYIYFTLDDDTPETRLNRFLVERTLLQHLRTNIFEDPTTDDSFWEPVKVGILFDQKLLSTGNHSEICFICSDSFEKISELPCCKKEMCENCIEKWFNESVKCPYCKQDLIEIIPEFETTIQ